MTPEERAVLDAAYLCPEAAVLIEQQAAKIAYLEAEGDVALEIVQQQAAEIERLKHLAKFARHADWCEVKPCSCGLYDEAAGELT